MTETLNVLKDIGRAKRDPSSDSITFIRDEVPINEESDDYYLNKKKTKKRNKSIAKNLDNYTITINEKDYQYLPNPV